MGSSGISGSNPFEFGLPTTRHTSPGSRSQLGGRISVGHSSIRQKSSYKRSCSSNVKVALFKFVGLLQPDTLIRYIYKHFDTTAPINLDSTDCFEESATK